MVYLAISWVTLLIFASVWPNSASSTITSQNLIVKLIQKLGKTKKLGRWGLKEELNRKQICNLEGWEEKIFI